MKTTPVNPLVSAMTGVGLFCLIVVGAHAIETKNDTTPGTATTRTGATTASTPAKPALDRSGRKRIGKASFYAGRFAGRKMADGERMDAHGNNAASKTLPLGTTAKVTNLETGKSTVVTIQDRGPYVGGRIVDLSPTTAEKIGITKTDGVAKVEVAPIAVPQADGGVKLGAAVTDSKGNGATKGNEHSNW